MCARASGTPNRIARANASLHGRRFNAFANRNSIPCECMLVCALVHDDMCPKTVSWPNSCAFSIQFGLHSAPHIHAHTLTSVLDRLVRFVLLLLVRQSAFNQRLGRECYNFYSVKCESQIIKLCVVPFHWHFSVPHRNFFPVLLLFLPAPIIHQRSK